jgi:hypothetical protein
MPQDLMCMAATVPNNVTVGDTEEYDSDSSMASVDKENIGSR